MSDNRKRSRWGGPPPPPPSSSSSSHQPTHNSVIANHISLVSDEDALNALLSSADARQREREEQLAVLPLRKQPRGGRHQEKNTFQRNDTDGRSQDRTKPNDSSRGNSQHGKSRRDDNYYGPSCGGNEDQDQHGDGVDEGKNNSDVEAKKKPNFGLSGALTRDEDNGNVYKGVVLKFSEPAEARAPNTQWRLYVFKGDENLETLHISKQSAYLFGRNEDISDIKLLHASCSSQHAVLQYRAVPNPETGKLQCSPYIMDLESTNGSFLNGVKLDSARYYQLKKGDVLKFGASTREYVLLTANTTSL